MSYGTKVLDENEAAIYITGHDGKVIGFTGIPRFCKSDEEANAVTQANADMAIRIAACLNACEGVGNGALASLGRDYDGRPLNNMLSEKRALVAQRDDLLAALKIALEALSSTQGDINPERGYAEELEAQVSSAADAARAAVAKVNAYDSLGAKNDRYTHITKGGSYDRGGFIRGAGGLKGMIGVTYRDEKGTLYVREMEDFNGRMKLVVGGAL